MPVRCRLGGHVAANKTERTAKDGDGKRERRIGGAAVTLGLALAVLGVALAGLDHGRSTKVAESADGGKAEGSLEPADEGSPATLDDLFGRRFEVTAVLQDGRDLFAEPAPGQPTPSITFGGSSTPEINR